MLIEIRANSSRFFNLGLTYGRINISFALDGVSGFIWSGRILVIAALADYKVDSEECRPMISVEDTLL